MNIYVGNLPHTATEDDLRPLFEAFGEVTEVKIMKDRYTGEPRGFGFVEMPQKAQAIQAIAGLNGKDLGGRPLTVNEAKPREERGAGSRPARGGSSGGGGFNRRNW